MFINYGITPDEYWNGDPRLASSYEKAYKIKESARNQELWLQGLYIYDGIGALFSDPKDRKKYPKEPYDIFAPSNEDCAKVRENARINAIRELNAFKDAWDRKHG